MLVGCGVPLFPSDDESRLDVPTGTEQTDATDGTEPTDRSQLPSAVEAVEGEAAELLRVIDGDSVEVDLSGEAVEIRLIGYNAPELYGPAAGGGAQRRTCNGEAARAELAELLETGSLLIAGDGIDRFGRRLADVVVDDRSIRAEMIDRGWGLATDGDPGGRELMKRAADRGLGLWGDGCGSPVETGLEIGPVQVDPPGSDRDNLNDEWVTVVNRSTTPIDLDGWVIRDDTTGHRFALTGALEAEGVLTIRSGRGSDTATDRHLGETFPVWSNNGETVLLVDPAGVVAHWAFID